MNYDPKKTLIYKKFISTPKILADIFSWCIFFIMLFLFTTAFGPASWFRFMVLWCIYFHGANKIREFFYLEVSEYLCKRRLISWGRRKFGRDVDYEDIESFLDEQSAEELELSLQEDFH